MPLPNKGNTLHERVLRFTVGEDPFLDLRLVKYDCQASQAHAEMLRKIGVLTEKEAELLISGLSEIMDLVDRGRFTISVEQEDGHTAIEQFLTEKFGEAGKKIHLGRSRNDQVLTALRLYEKKMLSELKASLSAFRDALRRAIGKYGKIPLPGYTHMRKAMPASVGMWLESFDCTVRDDLELLASVAKVIDQSPLGTAAGFGVPVYALDREMTAKKLGFSSVQSNPMYAQFSRGMFEMTLLSLFTGLMFIMNKLATDLMLFSMDEFGYVRLPDAFCTGSSIMPQKKNPDVLELVRAYYSVVLGEEIKVKSLAANLMSGYNRDLQLTKRPLFQAYDVTQECIAIMAIILTEMEINEEKCRSAMTRELYATEEAYLLVKEGLPFREAYRRVKKRYSGE